MRWHLTDSKGVRSTTVARGTWCSYSVHLRFMLTPVFPHQDATRLSHPQSHIALCIRAEPYRTFNIVLQKLKIDQRGSKEDSQAESWKGCCCWLAMSAMELKPRETVTHKWHRLAIPGRGHLDFIPRIKGQREHYLCFHNPRDSMEWRLKVCFYVWYRREKGRLRENIMKKAMGIILERTQAWWFSFIKKKKIIKIRISWV